MLPTHKAILLLTLVLTTGTAIPMGARAESPSDTLDPRIADGIRALESEDLESAARSFREALAADPRSAPAMLGLSQALDLQGDPVAALALARQALDIAPESAPATLAVARLLARLGASEQALGLLQQLRTLDPSVSQGYLLSALILRDLRRGDEAIELLEEALDNGLREPGLEEELSLLLLAANRPDEALERAEEALAAHGETAGNQLALGLAIAASTAADRSEAVTRLERAVELGVQDPGKVYLELGSLLLEIDRADEAIDPLEKAAELIPDSPEVYYKLGNAQRMTGDGEGARDSLARFQEIKARTEQQVRLELEIGTALNEAQELATSNRLPEALQRLDKLLAEHPSEVRVHILRAKILYSMRRQADALAAVERARQLDPTLVEPHYLEGMFLLQMNRPNEAKSALENAISLEPTLGEAYVLLGGAAAKLNQPAEAAAHFERALELGVDGPTLRLGYSAALESLGRLEESAQQDEAYRRLTQPPQ